MFTNSQTRRTWPARIAGVTMERPGIGVCAFVGGARSPLPKTWPLFTTRWKSDTPSLLMMLISAFAPEESSTSAAIEAVPAPPLSELCRRSAAWSLLSAWDSR